MKTVFKRRNKEKKKMSALFFILLLFLGFCVLFSSGEEGKIEITKTAQNEIEFGSDLSVRIIIKNSYDRNISMSVTEIVDFGEALDKENLVGTQNITKGKDGATIIDGISWFKPDEICNPPCKSGDKICDMDCLCTAAEDSDCAAFIVPTTPRYIWKIVVPKKDKKTIEYLVRPRNLGSFKISKTVAETAVGTFYSNELFIKVRCNENGICETADLNENHNNCPEDCASGGSDRSCDKKADGICDSDCPEYADVDCDPPVCGDSICEKNKGESYETCSVDCAREILCGDAVCDDSENFLLCRADCPSGTPDGYCDGESDKICDPDCTQRDLDIDCLCNYDKICDFDFETSLNCRADCSSGSADGYCDFLKDGVCDPDCRRGEDSDCKDNFLAYIIFGVLALMLGTFLVHKKFYKK